MKSNILSANNEKSERDLLFESFESKIAIDRDLDRTLVSYQSNKRIPFYNWFKYKEGFSAWLVQKYIEQTSKKRGVLLDPFAGSGTSLFVARSMGWDSIGIELLPVGIFSILSRLAAERVDAAEFKRYIDRSKRENWGDYFDSKYSLNHIPITAGAFSKDTENSIAGYRAFCQEKFKNNDIRELLNFALFCILEDISYTRKDGQYLRWDARSGRKNLKSNFNKGIIPGFAEALNKKLFDIYSDLSTRKTPDFDDFEMNSHHKGTIDLRKGSCLDILPMIEGDSIDLVVTSPPYCNRYDYTRTYALELVYLGLELGDVNHLRQKMLSCTVENRTKINELSYNYMCRKQDDIFKKIIGVYNGQSALHEVLDLLYKYEKDNLLNNPNIPRMVENYFREMCFTIFELTRVLRTNGTVVMVNDNVRYHGEEVPVDLILCDFAESFGLRVEKIWTLPRGKGNSSQQMGLHGRSELRKCVYVWRRP